MLMMPRYSLRLHIYRSLGISATQDPVTVDFNRAIVRRSPTTENVDGYVNVTKGDVNVINVDGQLNRGQGASIARVKLEFGPSVVLRRLARSWTQPGSLHVSTEVSVPARLLDH